MLQNEILVEALLVHLVDLGSVHEVDDLANTVDGLTVVDSYTVSHPSPCSHLRLRKLKVGGSKSTPLQKSANQGAA